jgi:DNA-binding LacI/PurR family transcriptional regulator
MARPHVIIDNCYAGYAMTQYLISQNRKHIAFMKFDKAFCRSVEDRFIGYKKALEKANMPLISEHIMSYDFPAKLPDMQKMIKRLVSSQPRPDAIIALTDGLVPMTVNTLRKCGFNVPQDIIVTGFDNLQNTFTGDTWPTTKPDFVQMGQRAAEILLERIVSGDLTPSGVVLPCPILLPEEQQNTESITANHQGVTGLLKA